MPEMNEAEKLLAAIRIAIYKSVVPGGFKNGAFKDLIRENMSPLHAFNILITSDLTTAEEKVHLGKGLEDAIQLYKCARSADPKLTLVDFQRSLASSHEVWQVFAADMTKRGVPGVASMAPSAVPGGAHAIVYIPEPVEATPAQAGSSVQTEQDAAVLSATKAVPEKAKNGSTSSTAPGGTPQKVKVGDVKASDDKVSDDMAVDDKANDDKADHDKAASMDKGDGTGSPRQLLPDGGIQL